jgi:hypothetical protein
MCFILIGSAALGIYNLLINLTFIFKNLLSIRGSHLIIGILFTNRRKGIVNSFTQRMIFKYFFLVIFSCEKARRERGFSFWLL